MVPRQVTRLAALAFFAPLLALTPHAASTQPAPAPGHWVNVQPADFGMWVLAIEDDGAAHVLMPAPQFEATYAIRGGRVVMRAGDGSGDSSLVVHGDTLVAGGRPAMLPLRGARGTWRAVPEAVARQGFESFMTLRSDGQVVLEVGPAGVTVKGDSLVLVREGSRTTFQVRLEGDTLRVEGDGHTRSFVRRPWGCLGVPGFDGPAKECAG